MLRVLNMKDIKSKGNIRNDHDEDISELARDIEQLKKKHFGLA